MVGRRPRDAERRNEGGLLQDAGPSVNPGYASHLALMYCFITTFYMRY